MAQLFLEASEQMLEFKSCKPRHIGRMLAIEVGTIHRLKRKLKLRKLGTEVPSVRRRLIDDVNLLDRVKGVVRDIGLPRVTAAGVVAKLRANPEVESVPSESSVRAILKEKFGLSFRGANAANIKYNDTSYDDKRRWVSRLLA